MMKFKTSFLGLFLFLVVFIPLGTTIIAQQNMDWPFRYERLEEPVIDIAYVSGDPDLAVGVAPGGMDLGIYINDALFTIAQSDKDGQFSVPLPALPKRVNRLTALPIEIDPSTLLIYYSASGYQQDRRGVGRPPGFLVQPPFIASASFHVEGLLIYGSTEPRSDVEICLSTCQEDSPRLRTISDNEGSFSGELMASSVNPGELSELFARIRYAGSSDWVTFDDPVWAFDGRGLQPSEPVISRNVQMTISPSEIQLTFDIDIPTGYKVYQNLVQGTISEHEFVRYLFGEIVLNTYFDPRKLTWREERQPGSEKVRIFIESEVLSYLIPQDASTTFQIDTLELSSSLPPYSDKDEIVLDLQGTHFLSAPLPPNLSTEEEHIWQGALADSPTNLFTVWVSRGGDAVLDRLTRLRLRDTLSIIFAELPGTYPVPLLRQTLEGSLVGLLPARIPAAAQAQIYDFYRELYLSDPFVSIDSKTGNLQKFVRDLPGIVAGNYEDLLFGGLWLIPSLLLIWSIISGKKDSKSRDANSWLAFIGLGAAILVLISLDWKPFLPDWFSRHSYLTWITAANTLFILGTVAAAIHLRRKNSSTQYWFIASVFLITISIGLTFGIGFLLFKLPDTWISMLLSSTQLLGWASIAWMAGQTHGQGKKWPSLGTAAFGILFILGISIPIRALPLNTRLSNNIGVSTASLSQIRPMLPLVVFLAVAYILINFFNNDVSTALDSQARRYGRVIFVAFVVGITPSWSYIPLSVLLSLLLFEWIFPRDMIAGEKLLKSFFKKSIKEKAEKKSIAEHYGKISPKNNFTGREKAIGDLLKLNKASRLRRAVEGSLQKQLREGKLIPAEYYAQQQKHEDQIAHLTRPEYIRKFDPKLTIRDLGFNFGVGPQNKENAIQALSWGIIFLIPLLLFSGIPLLTSDLSDFLPFPIINVGVRLGLLALGFLASAFFLGFFFPHIRGRNGLEKGGWLAGAIIISLLPVHLLLLDSIKELPALIIWAGSILTYNLLVGLIAFDLRTLSKYGFQTDRLTDLYNLSDIVFYLTGSGAPLITTIVSAAGGGLDELIPAITKVVFPALTIEGPQSELLKHLLDLVSQISGKGFK